MPSLDTNCLLRWLLGDIPEQAKLVSDLFDSGEPVVVSDVALIETVFVLEKLKKIGREVIAQAVAAVIGKDTVLCNRELFTAILPLYTNNPKLSFVDCYLAALAQRTGAAPLLTFDRKLANQLPDTRLLH
jgi:predicted nucleic-acid-binding protein